MHFNFGKILAGSLATAMFITNLSINSLSTSTVSAASLNKICPTYGKCGESADWLINSDGVLVISGTGEMSAYADNQSTDWGWRYLSGSINDIVIEDGITACSKVSSLPFYSDFCPNVSSIKLPPSITKLDYILAYPPLMSDYLNNIYIYSKDISDSNYPLFEYNTTNQYPWSKREVIWHVYKDSATEASLKENLSLNADQIEYIPNEEQMPNIDNKTPAEFEPKTDTSGPVGLTAKYEWNETSKTLTFSGTGTISIADYYKNYAEETEHIVIESGITVINSNTGICGKSGVSNPYYCSAFTGFTALKDVMLPDTLQAISDSAFCGTSLEIINFPKNLKKIGESAFSGCSKLKSINLHEGMTIGGGAFNSCTSLKEVTIPKNVTFAPTTFNGAGMVRDPVTFANCTGLENIVIEDGSVLKDTWQKPYTQNGIPSGFCSECSSLKAVVIRGGVDYIGALAFTCGTRFDVPSSLTDIYFYNTGLKTITPTSADANKISIDCSNNPTFHVVKGSQTEQTLRDAGYLTANNTKYVPDITDLQSAIVEAEKIDTSKYKDNTLINNLKTALENAKSVINNLDATQGNVDAAVKALNDAVSALTKPNTSVPTSPTSKVSPTTRNPEMVKKDKAAAEKLMQQAKIIKLKVKSKAKKKITVSWKKVKNAVGYQVQVSNKKNFKKNKIIFNKFTSKKKLTISKKIKSKKTYFVRVRAYATYKDTYGKPQKVYSKWNNKLRKVKVK